MWECVGKGECNQGVSKLTKEGTAGDEKRHSRGRTL